MGEAALITATLHDWEQLAEKIGKMYGFQTNKKAFS